MKTDIYKYATGSINGMPAIPERRFKGLALSIRSKERLITELIMRNQLAFPTNAQELKWWEEGVTPEFAMKCLTYIKLPTSPKFSRSNNLKGKGDDTRRKSD